MNKKKKSDSMWNWDQLEESIASAGAKVSEALGAGTPPKRKLELERQKQQKARQNKKIY